MATSTGMKVGSLAPPFALHPADGRSLASLDGRGRPWVLAFARSWSARRESPENMAAIRAELRGLGAVLLVLSDGGAWSFSPDDDVERIAAGGGDLAGEIADAARRYGVAGDAVFVIDAAGVVRFAHAPTGPLSPLTKTWRSRMEWAPGRWSVFSRNCLNRFPIPIPFTVLPTRGG